MTDASGRHRTVAHAAPTCHDPEENLAMHMARKLDAFEWTLEELHRLPDDGNKYELVRGELFVTPAPSLAHERLAVVLSDMLGDYVRRAGIGRVFRPRAVVRFRGSEVEPDVMVPGVDADGLETIEVDLLHFVGRRFEDHLQLVMLEQAIGILSEPAVIRTARRLDIRHVPRRRAQHPQQCFRMRGAGTDLEIERLLNQAALRGPKLLQLENQVLERHVTNAAARSTRERTVAPFRGASLSASDE